jgi:hypothetical protein
MVKSIEAAFDAKPDTANAPEYIIMSIRLFKWDTYHGMIRKKPRTKQMAIISQGRVPATLLVCVTTCF